MTSMIDRLAASVLLAGLLLACSNDSSGKSKPAAESTPAPTTAAEHAPATPPIAATGEAWADALVHCLPGNRFDACQAAMKGQVKLLPPLEGATEPHLRFGLEDPYDMVLVDTDPAAGNRIVLLRVQSSMKPGKDRHALVKWFNEHLKPEAKASATGNLACGASDGGSGWKFPGEDSPEVQYAIETHPTLRSAFGHDLDDYFVKAKSDTINICFLLPRSSKGGYVSTVTSASAMGEFIRSPLFKGKTRPFKH